jgi:hypothetical protein
MITLPYNWKSKIHAITQLHFCDHQCPCGENNQLWWFPPSPLNCPDWLPSWMNGADSFEIWQWLVQNGKVFVTTNNVCNQTGKQCHPTRAKAQKQLRSIKRNPRHWHEESYQCPFCDCWHIGQKKWKT